MSRLQIGLTATDRLSSMLNVFANFFCKIFMFLLLHLLHIKPWPGPGQAKARLCLMALAWPGV